MPDFDPRDGGASARLLLVLEKPGPGITHVSRDNPSATSAAIRTFMAAAAIPRDAVAIWNAVPWWNGTMSVTAAERVEGAAAFIRLLPLLPELRVVLLAGRAAGRLAPLLPPGLEVFQTVHPSPQVRAAFPREWRAIATTWREAGALLDRQR